MIGSKRQLIDNIENFARQNATFLAKQGEQNPNPAKRYRCIYKCKDCNKEYDTFQALGGHRAAAHRVTKLETGGDGPSLETLSKHELFYCRVCGKGFLIGQALGGHMRTHSWKKKSGGNDISDEKVGNAVTIGSYGHVDSVSCSTIASVGTSLSFKEVLEYDLNFTPEENESKDDVELLEQNSSFRTPVIDSF